MLKSVLKPCSVLVLAAWSSYACAVNMGGIHVTSSYNQPLRAEIELVNLTEQERANLTARLAAPEAYTRAGAEYPANFPKLEFQLAKRPSGAAYLRVSSDEPVKQKLVSLIVELSWASGKTQHQYSFLLDAPDFVPVQPKPVEVKPLAPIVATSAPEPAKPEPKIDTRPLPVATPAKPASPAPAVEAHKPQEAFAAKRFVKVRKGDTLHKIARRYHPEEVSVERMVAALYRVNKPAFEGRNMNRLEKGRVLRLPTENELASISQRRAVRLIRAHKIGMHAPVAHAPLERKLPPVEERATNNQAKPSVPEERDKPKDVAKTPTKEEPKGRLPKLSALSEEARAEAAREAGKEPTKPVVKDTPKEPAKQEASGKVGANLQTESMREQAQEVLRLSKGVDEHGGRLSKLDGQVKELQDKLNANEEDRIAREKTVKDHNERIVALEKNVEELRRLVAMKSEAGAMTVKPLEPPKAEEAASQPPVIEAASANEPVSAPAAVSAVASAPAKAKPEAKKEEKSGSLLTSPVVLGGTAALLLALGGLGYWIFKRGRKPAAPVKKPVRQEPEVTPESEPEPIAPEEAEMEAALDDVLKESAAAPVEATEPAVPFAEVLNQTMTEPSPEVIPEPESVPQAVEEPAISADDWAAAIEEQAAAQPVPEPLPDDVAVDLSFGNDFSAPAEEPSATSKAMSADQMAQAIAKLSQEQEVALAQQVADAAEAAAMAEPAAPAPEPASPVPSLDVPPAAAPAAQPAAEEPPFAIDIPVFGKETAVVPPAAQPSEATAFAAEAPAVAPTSPAPSAPVPPAAAMLQEIDLDLSGVQNAAPAEEVKDAHWHEVATKLDLARAYQEMGDSAGAREILDEVLTEGDAQQQATANEMIQQLSL